MAALTHMSDKNIRIASLIQELRGGALDPNYSGYFKCFNQQLYFEAHEVLEQIWLPQRLGPDGDFYKGLIQLAGAFVHLQKHRVGPAASLLNLAENNLSKYPAVHHFLELRAVLEIIRDWREKLLAKGVSPDLFSRSTPPKLVLIVP